jgi:hypothetical protein
VVGGAGVLAGCTSSGGDSDDADQSSTDATAESSSTAEGTPETESETNTETETPSEPEYDVVVDYSTHVQSSPSGEYDLPEPRYDDWGWLVLDLEVVEGELSMEDVWFNAFFETEERLHDVSHDSSDVEDGVESRGSIRQGGRGVVLHHYPPSPQGQLVGWNTSPMDQSVGGEGVIRDAPSELYAPVSVEYSVQTSTNPGILANEYATRRSEFETWAVVSVDVIDGFLNMEDVWFRSQLTTKSRRHDLSHSSSHAERGVRSRGMVKAGHSANALYLIGNDESVESWGYTEDGRQDVSISRR